MWICWYLQCLHTILMVYFCEKIAFTDITHAHVHTHINHIYIYTIEFKIARGVQIWSILATVRLGIVDSCQTSNPVDCKALRAWKTNLSGTRESRWISPLAGSIFNQPGLADSEFSLWSRSPMEKHHEWSQLRLKALEHASPSTCTSMSWMHFLRCCWQVVCLNDNYRKQWTVCTSSLKSWQYPGSQVWTVEMLVCFKSESWKHTRTFQKSFLEEQEQLFATKQNVSHDHV